MSVRTIVLVFIVIYTTLRPMCPSAFFRCFCRTLDPSRRIQEPSLNFETNTLFNPRCILFSSSASHILFALLEWFGRWEVSGCTAAVGCCFQDLFMPVHSILVLFLSAHSYMVTIEFFSLCILLSSMGCIHIVVCIQLQHERNPVIFYRIDQTEAKTNSLLVLDKNTWNNITMKIFGIKKSDYRAIGLMSRVFANGPGDWGSILGRVIPKTQKNST